MQARPTELHRHLDASLRVSTLHELARERGLTDLPIGEFRKRQILTSPQKDLSAVLRFFVLFQKVLDRPEVLERVAFEVVEDCFAEGVRCVELRFSPHFVGEFSGLPWEAILEAIERGIARGLKRYPEMQVGLIAIATRDYGVESVGRTVEFYLANRSRLVGVDLAGNEHGFPCRLFGDAFAQAKKLAEAGLANITIHSGEACGPENIWEAIEILGAQRIGHGIRCLEDPKLVRALAERRICLEICPTSNWICGLVPSLEQHPLPRILRAGVPVSINTDDPGIFGNRFDSEIELCRVRLGLSGGEIERCFETASRASFIQ